MFGSNETKMPLENFYRLRYLQYDTELYVIVHVHFQCIYLGNMLQHLHKSDLNFDKFCHTQTQLGIKLDLNTCKFFLGPRKASHPTDRLLKNFKQLPSGNLLVVAGKCQVGVW